MDEKELLKERFKAAVSSAVKVISEQLDLDVKFGNNLISKKNSSNFIQSLMDYGSIICLPNVPKCNKCVIQNRFLNQFY